MIKYIFKTTLSDKVALFWTLMFPIILTTLFMFAFKGLKNEDTFSSIPVAFVEVDNKEEGSLFQMMETINYESSKKMFILSELSLEDAQQQLNDKHIKAYIYQDELYLYENGMNETIIKTVMESYYQTRDQVTMLVNETALTYPEAIESVMKEQDYFNYTGEKSSSLLENYYYAVLGMVIMTAASFSLLLTAYILPNQSQVGMRISLSPQSKFKLLGLMLLVNLIIMMVLFSIVLLYYRFVIGLVFHNVFQVFTLTFVGALFAVTLGFSENILLSKLSFNTKVNLNVLIGVVGGFLSGMMFQPMKYIVSKYVPILSYINPVNLITDGFLSGEQYQNNERYYLNLILLLILTSLLIITSLFKFRREKYESL